MLATFLGLVLCCATPAAAQYYKWIGTDGRVNYGDRPPPGARPLGSAGAHGGLLPRAGGDARSGDGAAPEVPAGSTAAAGSTALPYKLQTLVRRYPVVLYQTASCQPCELARQHLEGRGIPYQVREVRNQADSQAFIQLGFRSLTFPAASIGAEQINGFDGAGWDRLLDAAGYPKQSELPRNWPAPQPEPLAPPAQLSPAPGSESGSEVATGTTVLAQEPALRF
ncbi:MAG: glutaredoxin family protein [Burkholderiaceae bacterium]